MKNLYEVLYYVTLQFYYRDGGFKNDHPYYTAFMIHAGAFAMQLILLKAVILVILEGELLGFRAGKLEIAGIIITATTIAYLLFAKGGKNFKIYEKYKHDLFYRGVFIKMLTVFYLLLSFSAPFNFAALHNYYFRGHI
jgi:hypothetical protein